MHGSETHAGVLKLASLCLLAFLVILVLQAGNTATSDGGGAAAAACSDMRGKDTEWSSAMQNARIPTAAELRKYMICYKTPLHDTILKSYRSAARGGTGQGRGRYKQVDTARISALEGAVIDLMFGKVPTDEDHRIFTAGNYREMTKEKNGATMKWMEGWKDRTCPDVRANIKGKDSLRQTSILEYAVVSGAHHGQTKGASAGRCAPCKYACTCVCVRAVCTCVYLRVRV